MAWRFHAIDATLMSTQASTISCFTSVPELSLSIIWKTWRAIDKNSALNSSSSAAAARAARARSSDSCCRRFARPRLIASSPVRIDQ